MDPGYIPLNADTLTEPHVTNESSSQLVTLPEQYPFVEAAHFSQDRVITVDGYFVECKFCYTCQSIRPPRTSHCSICNRCIFAHDHHCPWTGNCIGTCILSWFVFICTITEFILLLSDPQDANITNIGNHFESILLILFTFLMGSSLLYLAGYHCYLVSKNLTTHEQLRSKYTHRLSNQQGPIGNPFDKGIWRNIKMVLFDKPDSQKINFDYWNQEEKEA